MNLKYKDCQLFFEDVGSLQLMCRNNWGAESWENIEFSVEELYQQFKERLVRELELYGN